jgi:hypothetical protein
MAEQQPGEVAGQQGSEASSLTDAAVAGSSLEVLGAIGPVAQTERYVVMDVLRGFALFGVLAANMRSFNLPMGIYPTPEKIFSGRADVWTQALLDIFISAKFYTLFAFLFGLGFAIQMTRAAARSSKFPWFYLRRLAALATMGLIHGIFNLERRHTFRLLDRRLLAVLVSQGEAQDYCALDRRSVGNIHRDCDWRLGSSAVRVEDRAWRILTD